MAAFASLGYPVCAGEDLEAGYERIALFADGDGRPTHAARQLLNGRWSSKLGKAEDIEHGLHDLEGALYGSVVLILKRLVPPLTEGTAKEEGGQVEKEVVGRKRCQEPFKIGKGS